jgi:hypothetical protein
MVALLLVLSPEAVVEQQDIQAVVVMVAMATLVRRGLLDQAAAGPVVATRHPTSTIQVKTISI